jgi:nicotinamide-nucleotide amidase
MTASDATINDANVSLGNHRKVGAEILCIGTELLLGEIVNTNAQYLAQQLAMLGIPHYYQTVVGDNPDRIKQALAIASQRAQIIITTGGLGPTPDDLTTATIADFFGAPLIEDPQIWTHIQELYGKLGRTITANNRKQALLPAGAAILPNPVGSAPGLIWEPQPDLLIMTFPGVPRELYSMWQQTAVPLLKTKGYSQGQFFSKVLLYWDIAESALAEQVNDLFASSNPTVAPYANYGQARLRITAKANSPEAAQALIEPMATEILRRTGDYCYGTDEDTLSSVIGGWLRDKGQTLAVAESCTGGWLGQMITETAGSSAYFLGGIISYSNQVKENMLGVSPVTLAQYGAVSAETAQEMALGVKQRLGADWGVSITGIAGPDGGTDAKPVGLVYITVADPQGAVTTTEHHFSPSRDRNWLRRLSTYSSLNNLRKRFVMIS